MKYYKGNYKKVDAKFTKDFFGYEKHYRQHDNGQIDVKLVWIDKNYRPQSREWTKTPIKATHDDFVRLGYQEYTPEHNRIAALRSDSLSMNI